MTQRVLKTRSSNPVDKRWKRTGWKIVISLWCCSAAFLSLVDWLIRWRLTISSSYQSIEMINKPTGPEWINGRIKVSKYRYGPLRWLANRRPSDWPVWPFGRRCAACPSTSGSYSIPGPRRRFRPLAELMPTSLYPPLQQDVSYLPAPFT